MSLSSKAGLSIPVENGKAVNVYIMAINEEEDSAIAQLAIASIGRVSGSTAVKFYKGFGKKGFFKGLNKYVPLLKAKDAIDFVVGEATEYTVNQLMEYLEDNKIGAVKIHIDPMTIASNKYISKEKLSEEGTVRISYDMEFSEEDKNSIVSSSSTQSTSTSKWFSPTDKEVSWKKAKQICRDNGGRLPTIEELKKVVTGCGGINTTWSDKDWESITNKNIENKSYQACYKRKGFNSSNYYWSSSIIEGDEEFALLVGFNGIVEGFRKDGSSNFVIRCVRGGQ